MRHSWGNHCPNDWTDISNVIWKRFHPFPKVIVDKHRLMTIFARSTLRDHLNDDVLQFCHFSRTFPYIFDFVNIYKQLHDLGPFVCGHLCITYTTLHNLLQGISPLQPLPGHKHRWVEDVHDDRLDKTNYGTFSNSIYDDVIILIPSFEYMNPNIKGKAPILCISIVNWEFGWCQTILSNKCHTHIYTYIYIYM